MASLRAHMLFDRGGGAIEDRAMCTFDFFIPVLPWPQASPRNYEAAEDRFVTFWNTLRLIYHPTTVFTELRWYREDDDQPPWGEPARVTDFNVPGQGGGNPLPPQVSISVTERTVDRKRWGRFYLPAPSTDALVSTGRIGGLEVARVAGATETLYEQLISAVGIYPIVRHSSGPFLANYVLEVQVDDVFDVQRRRRWETTLLRDRRVLAGTPPP